MPHRRILLDDALLNHSATHAAHIALYYKEQCKEKQNGSEICFVLMQIRSDGMIGFPGGVIDEDIKRDGRSAIVEGLQRELREEINFNESLGDFVFGYICSHERNDIKEFPKGLICHFFAQELSRSDFMDIERNHQEARDFPKEQLGIFRVPIVTKEIDGHKKVLPANNDDFWVKFVQFPFIGNAREQLMCGLEKCGVIAPGELDRYQP